MWNKQSKWLHTGGRGWNPGWAQTALILLHLRLKEREEGTKPLHIIHAWKQQSPPHIKDKLQQLTRQVDTSESWQWQHTASISGQQWRKMTLALSGTGRGASAAALVALFIWSTSSGLSSHNSLTSTWITTTPRKQPGKKHQYQLRSACQLSIWKKRSSSLSYICCRSYNFRWRATGGTAVVKNRSSMIDLLTDLLSAADFPLVPLHHHRGLYGVRGLHRCWMHTAWVDRKKQKQKKQYHFKWMLNHTVKLSEDTYKRRLTITAADLYGQSDKQSGQAALHVSCRCCGGTTV